MISNSTSYVHSKKQYNVKKRASSLEWDLYSGAYGLFASNVDKSVHHSEPWLSHLKERKLCRINVRMIWDVQSSSLNKYQCPSSFTVYKVLCCTFEPHATLWGRYYYYSHFIDKTTETIKVACLQKVRGASWPVWSRCGIQAFQHQMPHFLLTWLPYTQHLLLWLGYWPISSPWAVPSAAEWLVS